MKNRTEGALMKFQLNAERADAAKDAKKRARSQLLAAGMAGDGVWGRRAKGVDKRYPTQYIVMG